MATVSSTILGLARRYRRAIVAAEPQLPEATRLVLVRGVGAADVAWGLSVVIAAWRLKAGSGADAQALGQLLTDTGAAPLVDQIGGLSGSFPKSFESFLTAAEAAADADSPKVAAAASYFSSTVAALPDFARSGLHRWLLDQRFQDAAVKLFEVVGLPGDSKPQPRPRARPTPRQDAPTTPGRTPVEQRQETVWLPPQDRPKEPRDFPDPDGDLPSFVGAYLITLGWGLPDVSRILVGPDRSHLTAEELFRKWAGQQPPTKEQVWQRLSRLHADRLTANPLLVGEPNDQELGPVTAVSSAEDILREFDTLPETQRTRFLLLLSQRRQERPPVMPKASPPAPRPRPGPPKATPKTTPPPEATPKKTAPSSPPSSGDDVSKVVVPIVTGGLAVLKELLGQALGGGTKKDGAPKAEPGKKGGGSPKMTEPPEDEPEEGGPMGPPMDTDVDRTPPTQEPDVDPEHLPSDEGSDDTEGGGEDPFSTPPGDSETDDSGPSADPSSYEDSSLDAGSKTIQV